MLHRDRRPCTAPKAAERRVWRRRPTTLLIEISSCSSCSIISIVCGGVTSREVDDGDRERGLHEQLRVDELEAERHACAAPCATPGCGRSSGGGSRGRATELRRHDDGLEHEVGVVQRVAAAREARGAAVVGAAREEAVARREEGREDVDEDVGDKGVARDDDRVPPRAQVRRQHAAHKVDPKHRRRPVQLASKIFRVPCSNLGICKCRCCSCFCCCCPC